MQDERGQQITFICNDGYELRDVETWRWMCEDWSFVHNNMKTMDVYLSEQQTIQEEATDIINFRVLGELGKQSLSTINPFQKHTKITKVKKLNLFTSEVVKTNLGSEFKDCTNILFYKKFLISVCDLQGVLHVVITDIKNLTK